MTDPTPPAAFAGARAVAAGADLAGIARRFVDERLRSVPALENGALAGIVSRRDVPRARVRPDESLVSTSTRRPVVVGVEGSGRDEDVLGFAFTEAALRRAEPVAVGLRDRGPLGRLGSVTHGAAHRAGCPVAAVPVEPEPGR